MEGKSLRRWELDTSFKPKLVEPKTHTELETKQNALVPGTPSAKVTQALEQRVEKEMMGMTPSLSRVMAQNTMQATLDLHRGYQTERIGSEVLESAINAMVHNNEIAQRVIAEHPGLEAEIQEMVNAHQQMLKQLPRVIPVGYLRRYHQLGSDCPHDDS